MTEPTAIVVTLQLEAQAAARFTALRRAWFPPERNWLDAHVTLFHALPVGAIDRVLDDAADVARSTAPFAPRVDGVRFLGQGVAYDLSSPEGTGLRKTLAARWDDLLGRQDRAGPGRLHVTVQNKVDAATARALHARLAAAFVPEAVGAIGVGVWHYLGGPWRRVAELAFDGRSGMPAP